MSTELRDLRLDYFRGWALWFIFIDHVPGTFISRLTFRNFGFSDATEIFVFISGFSAALVYGRQLHRFGVAYTCASVAKRCLQLYVAHIVLCVLFVAQIAFIAARFDNPSYLEELNVARFLERPDLALGEALVLHLRPANLDILPLYMALLLVMPLIAWGLARRPWLVLAASALLYTGVQQMDWVFPVYQDGDVWNFNPLGWQFLFVIGAFCAMSPPGLDRIVRWRGWLAGLSVACLLISLFMVLSWDFPHLQAWIPEWIGEWAYPIDKTDLDVLRLLHFLAVAYLATQLVKRDSAFLRATWWRPVVLCGQHSLYVFCIGVYLSFVAHFVLAEINDSIPMQILVVVAGLTIMCAMASLFHWYRHKGTQATTAMPVR